MSYLKNLAGDLLSLEVNTIVKDNTTSSKMPSTKRYTLLSIANTYRDVLTSYGICKMENEESSNPNCHRLLWRFGGEYSFSEIYKQASRGIDLIVARKENAESLEKLRILEQQLRMLQRIARHSSNFIGMYKARKKPFEKEGGGYIDKPTEDVIDPVTGLYPSQPQEKAWNNDVSLEDINELPDIDVAPDEIALIKKTWEIGTQQVLMQTVVQIDGDIANYLATSFIELPEEMRRMVLEMHNESTESATRVWQMLFQTIAQLAGKAFREIFNSK